MLEERGAGSASGVFVQESQPILRMCEFAPALEDEHIGVAVMIRGGDERAGQVGNVLDWVEDADALRVCLDHAHLAARVGDKVVEGMEVPHACEQVNRLA